MLEKKLIFLPYKLHLRHLLFALSKKMSVTVLLPPEKSLPKDTKLHGIPIKYRQFGADIVKPLFGREMRTLKYVDGLSKLLDNENFDALVTFEFYHWYTLQCIAYKKRHMDFKLFVVSETKHWPRNLVAHIFKRILLLYLKVNMKYIDCIFVYTQAAQEFLGKYVPDAKVVVLPTPINPKMFKLNLENTGKKFFSGGYLRLLMNARYSPYKRHKDLFAALRKLHREGKHVRLTCISRDEKGKKDISALAQRMKVANMVDFIDPLPLEQMPELFYSHDVLVLPSYNEAIGMVVPEAMACGVPTVTSDTVGANIYVAEGETGFIYKTGDVDALVDVLNRCFDPQLLKGMGKKAHKRIMDQFAPNAIATKFLKSIKI